MEIPQIDPNIKIQADAIVAKALIERDRVIATALLEKNKQVADPEIKAKEIVATAQVAHDEVVATALLENQKWILNNAITKQKIYEILITALLSAGIAVMQAYASQFLGHSVPVANPETAGIVGAAIHTLRKLS